MGRMNAVFDVRDPESFVWSWVADFQGQLEMEPEDLRQEGLIALIEAARTYQPARGTFATYAGSAIKHRFIQLLEDEKMRRRGRGRRDTEEVSVVSLDEPVLRDGKRRLRHDVVGQEDPGFEKVHRRQLHGFVARAAQKLSPRSREIFNRRFADDQTLGEIGESLDINRERVRQILQEDLSALRARVERVAR